MMRTGREHKEIKRYWNFDLKKDLKELIENIENKKCETCEQLGIECSKNDLHVSYRYITETENGSFLISYFPGDHSGGFRFTSVQFILLGILDELRKE